MTAGKVQGEKMSAAFEHALNGNDDAASIMNAEKVKSRMEENEKRDEVPPRTVKESVNEYFNITSIGGLFQSYFFYPQDMIFTFVWGLVFVVGLAVTSWHMSTLIVNYFDYPINVKVSIKRNNTIEFPAVTVCNLNPLKLSQVDVCGKMGQLISVQKELSKIVLSKNKDELLALRRESGFRSYFGKSCRNTTTTVSTTTATTVAARRKKRQALVEQSPINQRPLNENKRIHRRRKRQVTSNVDATTAGGAETTVTDSASEPTSTGAASADASTDASDTTATITYDDATGSTETPVADTTTASNAQTTAVDDGVSTTTQIDQTTTDVAGTTTAADQAYVTEDTTDETTMAGGDSTAVTDTATTTATDVVTDATATASADAESTTAAGDNNVDTTTVSSGTTEINVDTSASETVDNVQTTTTTFDETTVEVTAETTAVPDGETTTVGVAGDFETTDATTTGFVDGSDTTTSSDDENYVYDATDGINTATSSGDDGTDTSDTTTTSFSDNIDTTTAGFADGSETTTSSGDDYIDASDITTISFADGMDTTTSITEDYLNDNAEGTTSSGDYASADDTTDDGTNAGGNYNYDDDAYWDNYDFSDYADMYGGDTGDMTDYYGDDFFGDYGDSYADYDDYGNDFISEDDANNVRKFLQDSKLLDLTDESIGQMGYNASEFIIECSFDRSKKCSHAGFYKFVDKVYGNCFTFNSVLRKAGGARAIRTRNSGSRYGLRLTLNILADEYIGLLAPDYGVRVAVHSPYEEAEPAERGISAPPGIKTSIAVQRRVIIRKESPFPSNCTNAYPSMYSAFTKPETTYTHKQCTDACLDYNLCRACGCVQKEPGSRDAKECDIFNEASYKCRANVIRRIRMVDGDNSDNLDTTTATTTANTAASTTKATTTTTTAATTTTGVTTTTTASVLDVSCADYDPKAQEETGSIECHCQPKCEDHKFDMRSSQSVWPSTPYVQLKALNFYSTNKHDQLASAFMQHLRNGDDDDALKKNYVRLEIYLDSMDIEVIEEVAAYPFSQLVADAGGVLGLYLGMTLISLIEAGRADSVCPGKLNVRSEHTWSLDIFIIAVIQLLVNLCRAGYSQRKRLAAQVGSYPAPRPSTIYTGNEGEDAFSSPQIVGRKVTDADSGVEVVDAPALA